MTTLKDVEATFRALAIGDGGDALVAGGAFGAAPERLRLYRSLVQNTLRSAIRRACPHARRLGGEARLEAHVSRFLDTSKLETRFVRDLPGAFSQWLLADAAEHHRDGDDAVAYAELVHFEALEVEVTMAETSPQGGLSLSDDVTLEMDGSTRLCIYRHPVHTVTLQTSALSSLAPSAQPYVLVCFQRAEAFAVEPVAAAVGKVLIACTDGATVGAAIKAVVDEGIALGVSVDVGLVRSALVKLRRLGAIAAFVEPT